MFGIQNRGNGATVSGDSTASASWAACAAKSKLNRISNKLWENAHALLMCWTKWEFRSLLQEQGLTFALTSTFIRQQDYKSTILMLLLLTPTQLQLIIRNKNVPSTPRLRCSWKPLQGKVPLILTMALWICSWRKRQRQTMINYDDDRGGSLISERSLRFFLYGFVYIVWNVWGVRKDG